MNVILDTDIGDGLAIRDGKLVASHELKTAPVMWLKPEELLPGVGEKAGYLHDYSLSGNGLPAGAVIGQIGNKKALSFPSAVDVSGKKDALSSLNARCGWSFAFVYQAGVDNAVENSTVLEFTFLDTTVQLTARPGWGDLSFLFSGGDEYFLPSISNSEKMVLFIGLDESRVELHKNLAPDSGGTYTIGGTWTGADFLIGAGTQNRPMVGNIGEMIAFPRIISEQDRISLVQYLMTKWQI